jgi:hypothetical protein
VVLYFVDDPHGEVPVGPVTYNYAVGRVVAQK